MYLGDFFNLKGRLVNKNIAESNLMVNRDVKYLDFFRVAGRALQYPAEKRQWRMMIKVLQGMYVAF